MEIGFTTTEAAEKRLDLEIGCDTWFDSLDPAAQAGTILSNASASADIIGSGTDLTTLTAGTGVQIGEAFAKILTVTDEATATLDRAILIPENATMYVFATLEQWQSRKDLYTKRSKALYSAYRQILEFCINTDPAPAEYASAQILLAYHLFKLPAGGDRLASIRQSGVVEYEVGDMRYKFSETGSAGKVPFPVRVHALLNPYYLHRQPGRVSASVYLPPPSLYDYGLDG